MPLDLSPMAHKPLLSNILNGQAPLLKPKSLVPSIHADLSSCIKGTVYSRGDPCFENHSKIFNGDVVSQASLLALPFDAEDISQIVKFGTHHSLSLSVKAGGYGTHGQAIQGDIIVDLSLLNDIHIETINSQGGFTSLKDMPSAKNAGKTREISDEISPDTISNPSPQTQTLLSASSGKRRADDAFNDSSSKESFSRDLTMGVPFTADTIYSDDRRPPPKLLRSDASSKQSPPVVIHKFGPSARSEPNPSKNTRKGGSTLKASEGDNISSFSGITDGMPKDLPMPKSLPEQLTTPFDMPMPAATGDPFNLNTGPSHSDPFGYMSDSAAGLSTAPLLPAFDTGLPGVALQSFLQAGPALFSATGHYMPTRSIPSFPHAYVTFGAGAKQKDVDTHTSTHPLPATSLEGTPCFTPYHVPFPAHPVGTSNMLLGGFGFLSRLHGLSIDNLVEVEMVLADGSIVVVNENEYPDLWWAMCGAGTAFGIATRYKAKAYPVPVVFAGNLLYKFRRSTAASLIKHFRDCVKNVPRELYANVILTAGPDGDALLAIQICYLGTQEQGAEYLQAIMSWDGEQCLLNEVSEKSFLIQQDSLAQLLRGKPGRKWFIRSNLLSSLTDEMIHETVMRFADTPPGCTWLFELSGGNVSDEHGGCFPASVRQATWTVAAFHQWELYEDDPRCVTSAEEWMNDTLGPASTGGPFPSFFGIHESGERIKGSFGDNWQRLCELKRKYDPQGLFTHNFWPLDKDERPKTTLVPTRTEF